MKATTSDSLTEQSEFVENVDAIAKHIQRFAVEPDYSKELKRRGSTPDFSISDSQIMERMIELIAFSEQAQSKLVAALRDSGVFRRVFADFDPVKVASLKPE